LLDIYNHLRWNCRFMFIGMKSHLAYYKLLDFVSTYDRLFDNKHVLHLVVVPKLYPPLRNNEPR
jgi:hypothetical protein